MSEKWIKNGFHYLKNPFPIIETQDSFKNTFPRDGKIKLEVAGLFEKRRKEWFTLAKKSVFPSRNKVIFHKLVFLLCPSRKKFLNKRILFQLNRKSRMENSFKKTCLLEGKLLPLKKYLKNQIKWLPIAGF